MIEFVLLVWLVSCEGAGPCEIGEAVEVGTYRFEDACIEERDKILEPKHTKKIGTVAMCVERDK